MNERKERGTKYDNYLFTAFYCCQSSINVFCGRRVVVSRAVPDLKHVFIVAKCRFPSKYLTYRFHGQYSIYIRVVDVYLDL